MVGSLDTQRIHMSGEGRRVNSMVETLVNGSLSYLDLVIKRKTPSYQVRTRKRVIIPRIDLNPKTGQYFADTSLEMNQRSRIGIVSLQPMFYSDADIYVPRKGKGQYRT